MAVGGALERLEGRHAELRATALASPTCRPQPMFGKLGRVIPQAARALLSACSH